MWFECHVCGAAIPEAALIAHLRSHSVEEYADVYMLSTKRNILDLCEKKLIAAFNNKYEELKRFTNDLQSLPNLEIKYTSEDTLNFQVTTGKQKYPHWAYFF